MYRTEVCEVFEVEREGEEDQFNDLGNRYVVSIISFTAAVVTINYPEKLNLCLIRMANILLLKY